MNPRTFFGILLHLGLAGVVLLLSHYGYAWVAAPLVLLPAVATWWRHGRSRRALLAASPSAIIGLSVVILVGLSRPLGQPVFPVVTQMLITLLYGLWLIWLWQLRRAESASLVVLAVQQVVGVAALFLAAAFWHWPDVVVVALTWAVVMATTLWYGHTIGERSSTLLAAAWALVAAQVAWVLYIWQVNYILAGGSFVIPQAALVILGIGYCFANIYYSHTQKKLSRRRLIEYVAISGVLLAIVVAGTRWNGTA